MLLVAVQHLNDVISELVCSGPVGSSTGQEKTTLSNAEPSDPGGIHLNHRRVCLMGNGVFLRQLAEIGPVLNLLEKSRASFSSFTRICSAAAVFARSCLE